MLSLRLLQFDAVSEYALHKRDCRATFHFARNDKVVR